MTQQSSTRFGPNLVIGLGIAALGLVLLLDRLGLANASELLRYWPVLLVPFSASVMWQALRGGPAGHGQPPLVAPGLIVFLVLFALLFSFVSERRSRRADGVPNTGESTNLAGIMSRDERESRSPNFRGAETTSVMGRSVLDLRSFCSARTGRRAVSARLQPAAAVRGLRPPPLHACISGSSRTRSS